MSAASNLFRDLHERRNACRYCRQRIAWPKSGGSCFTDDTAEISLRGQIDS